MSSEDNDVLERFSLAPFMVDEPSCISQGFWHVSKQRGLTYDAPRWFLGERVAPYFSYRRLEPIHEQHFRPGSVIVHRFTNRLTRNDDDTSVSYCLRVYRVFSRLGITADEESPLVLQGEYFGKRAVTFALPDIHSLLNGVIICRNNASSLPLNLQAARPNEQNLPVELQREEIDLPAGVSLALPSPRNKNPRRIRRRSQSEQPVKPPTVIERIVLSPFENTVVEFLTQLPKERFDLIVDKARSNRNES